MGSNLTFTLITKQSKAKHEHGKWEKKNIHRKTHRKTHMKTNTQINIPTYPETSMGETKGVQYSSLCSIMVIQWYPKVVVVTVERA